MRNRVNLLARLLGAVSLLAAASIPVYAQSSADVHPQLTSTFFADLGVYFPRRNLKLGVNGTVTGENDSIDFDEGLKLGRSDATFALDFGWRFGEKWSFLAQYFESSGTSSAVLDEDIEWRDVVFGAGSSVSAGQDFTLLRTFFGRSFDSADYQDFGVGLGLHILEIGAFIEGNAIVNGVPGGLRQEGASATAPLPNIGGWYTYSISPSWAFHSRLDWFGASFGDYDGRLINASVGINYNLKERFGLGIHYNHFELDVDVSKTNWHGDVKLSYSGIYANMSVYW